MSHRFLRRFLSTLGPAVSGVNRIAPYNPPTPISVASVTHPPIRSYVLRQGRFSPGQQRAYEELLPRYGVAYRPEPLDFTHVFGRTSRVVAEIGFGMGETTARIAQDNPDVDYLAMEVHSPGVGS